MIKEVVVTHGIFTKPFQVVPPCRHNAYAVKSANPSVVEPVRAISSANRRSPHRMSQRFSMNTLPFEDEVGSEGESIDGDEWGDSDVDLAY